ncbi:MAG: hypothetical protein PHR35_21185, partial [Kiritimatiellae bacterium]|nr:hypothetical protein [Kiritimatiellia bacterium]
MLSTSARVNAMRAFERLLFAAAALLAGLAAAAAADFVWRYGQRGRMVLCGACIVLAAGGVAAVARALRRRRSPEAVAALLEKHFPELDNRLINQVQMSAIAAPSPLEQAYLREAAPSPASLPLRRLRNRRARRWGGAALAVALLALALPLYTAGSAWRTALWRVINPFSALAPASLARVIEVTPGNAEMTQGAATALACRATGRAGQTVDLDLWPDDDALTTIRLGRLTGSPDETFMHPIARLTGGLSYRFRVGDAMPTARFRLAPLPPLAPVSLRLEATPPPYTRRATSVTDGLTSPATVPAGSTLGMEIRFNRPVTTVMAAIEPADPTPLAAADGGIWRGALTSVTGNVLRVVARDARNQVFSVPYRLALLPDHPPVVRLLQPSSPRAALPPGVLPAIQFEAADDYAVTGVRLERVPPDARPDDPGAILASWPASNGVVNAAWQGTLADIRPDAGLRLVAEDEASPRSNRTVSAVLMFESTGAGALLAAEQQRAAAAGKNLLQLVEWQRNNLRATTELAPALPNFEDQSWRPVHELQARIQTAADALLRSAALPAAQRALLERAARGAMAEAPAVLARTLLAAAAERAPLANRAVSLEQEILRLLTQAQSSYAKSQAAQSASGLLALIEALVKGEGEVVTALAGKSVPPALVARQDALAVDLGEFLKLCLRDAETQSKNDAPFAKTLTDMVARAGELKLKTEMLAAAEAIEAARLADAAPPAGRALTGLKELHAMMNAWRADDTAARTESLESQVAALNDALDKLEALQGQVVESLRPTSSQGDKSGTPAAELAQELAELKGAMADATLKLANDLQALPELPVGNELVADVYQVYEAMEQAEGSATAAVTELGLQKEDWILDA